MHSAFQVFYKRTLTPAYVQPCHTTEPHAIVLFTLRIAKHSNISNSTVLVDTKPRSRGMPRLHLLPAVSAVGTKFFLCAHIQHKICLTLSWSWLPPPSDLSLLSVPALVQEARTQVKYPTAVLHQLKRTPLRLSRGLAEHSARILPVQPRKTKKKKIVPDNR